MPRCSEGRKSPPEPFVVAAIPVKILYLRGGLFTSRFRKNGF
jgi:hypothetical protein